MSYWRFEELNQCRLKGLFPLHVVTTPANLPVVWLSSRRAVLGEILHEALARISEQAKKTGWPEPAQLHALCEAARKSVTAKFTQRGGGDRYDSVASWPDYGTVLSAVAEVPRRSSTSPVDPADKPQFFPEYDVYSTDSRIAGRPDLIIRRGDHITLIDYKWRKREITDSPYYEQYVAQLQVYAALIEERWGVFPHLAYLVSNGKRHRVVLQQTRASQLLNDMQHLLEDINRQVANLGHDASAFAKPSEEACSTCAAKPWCGAYRDQLQVIPLPQKRHILWGYQEGSWQENRRTGVTITLRSEQHSFGRPGATIKLTRVPKTWFPQLEDRPGQAVIVTNVHATPGANAAACSFETQILPIG
nr:PD-(D/E)XK nuclease family protein [Microbulbifer rhizosphaerae]